jgi:hypothetical protein
VLEQSSKQAKERVEVDETPTETAAEREARIRLFAVNIVLNMPPKQHTALQEQGKDPGSLVIDMAREAERAAEEQFPDAQDKAAREKYTTEYVKAALEKAIEGKATPPTEATPRIEIRKAQAVIPPEPANGQSLQSNTNSATTDQQLLRPLLTAWLNASNSNDPQLEANLYTDPVDFLGEGSLNRDQLIDTLQKDLTQWPLQHHSTPHVLEVQKLDPSTWRMVFDVTFDVKNPRNGNARAGTTNISWTVRRTDSGELQIASVRSRVTNSFTPSSGPIKRKPETERVYESRPVSP